MSALAEARESLTYWESRLERLPAASGPQAARGARDGGALARAGVRGRAGAVRRRHPRRAAACWSPSGGCRPRRATRRGGSRAWRRGPRWRRSRCWRPCSSSRGSRASSCSRRSSARCRRRSGGRPGQQRDEEAVRACGNGTLAQLASAGAWRARAGRRSRSTAAPRRLSRFGRRRGEPGRDDVEDDLRRRQRREQAVDLVARRGTSAGPGR